MTEPWLRGTLTDVPPILRALLHSLEMAEEDIAKWCGHLSEAQLHERPLGLPSVAFQIRHIARSLDRFSTYAEGSALTADQLASLDQELNSPGSKETILREFADSLEKTRQRLKGIAQGSLDQPIAIGRERLPTTLGGLLVHAAEHTQRHVGQAVTTAKVLRGRQYDPSSPA